MSVMKTRRLNGLLDRRLTRGLDSAKMPTAALEKIVVQIKQKELEAHRDEIVADVKKMVENYRKIFDWDVPNIDQTVADKLIVLEVRKALDELEINCRVKIAVNGGQCSQWRHADCE
jgi:hypothetical protein